MRRIHVVTALGLAVVASCGGGSAQPTTIPPTSPTVAPLPTLPDTTAAPATADAAVATMPAGVIGLSPDGPWRLVDSAPGVTTPGLFYELMPGLWAYLPVVEDIPNGITWTLNEEDRPIIEAYLQAKRTYYLAVTSNPIDLDHPGWEEWFSAEEAADRRRALEDRRAQGQVVQMDVGVVLRPQVIGDDRSEQMGVVFDCVLDGSYFVLADGSLAYGSSVGVGSVGSGYRLELIAGRWVVTDTGRQSNACG